MLTLWLIVPVTLPAQRRIPCDCAKVVPSGNVSWGTCPNGSLDPSPRAAVCTSIRRRAGTG